MKRNMCPIFFNFSIIAFPDFGIMGVSMKRCWLPQFQFFLDNVFQKTNIVCRKLCWIYSSWKKIAFPDQICHSKLFYDRNSFPFYPLFPYPVGRYSISSPVSSISCHSSLYLVIFALTIQLQQLNIDILIDRYVVTCVTMVLVFPGEFFRIPSLQ